MVSNRRARPGYRACPGRQARLGHHAGQGLLARPVCWAGSGLQASPSLRVRPGRRGRLGLQTCPSDRVRLARHACLGLRTRLDHSARYYLGGLTHLSPNPNPLERGPLGTGAFFGTPKRGLNEEWARAGPWARGQIDTSN